MKLEKIASSKESRSAGKQSLDELLNRLQSGFDLAKNDRVRVDACVKRVQVLGGEPQAAAQRELADYLATFSHVYTPLYTPLSQGPATSVLPPVPMQHNYAYWLQVYAKDVATMAGAPATAAALYKVLNALWNNDPKGLSIGTVRQPVKVADDNLCDLEMLVICNPTTSEAIAICLRTSLAYMSEFHGPLRRMRAQIQKLQRQSPERSVAIDQLEKRTSGRVAAAVLNAATQYFRTGSHGMRFSVYGGWDEGKTEKPTKLSEHEVITLLAAMQDAAKLLQGFDQQGGGPGGVEPDNALDITELQAAENVGVRESGPRLREVLGEKIAQNLATEFLPWGARIRKWR